MPTISRAVALRFVHQRFAKKLLNDIEDALLSLAVELEGQCYDRLRSFEGFPREGRSLWREAQAECSRKVMAGAPITGPSGVSPLTGDTQPYIRPGGERGVDELQGSAGRARCRANAPIWPRRSPRGSSRISSGCRRHRYPDISAIWARISGLVRRVRV